MPVYTLEGPDGKTYDVEGPPGATAEELGEFVTSQTRAKATPERGMSERLWEGVKGGASRLRDELLPPGNPVHALSMGTIGTDDVAGRKADLTHYEATKGELGTAGAIGDVLPEIALTALPIARAGTAIGRAPMLAKTLGRYAPAAGDIAANAGYEAGKAGYSGGDVGTSAAVGAGGAAAGRVLSRTLGGMKPLLSRDSQALIDNGVMPTPGQMLGPVGRFAEDAASVLPGVGHVIDYSRNRALGQYAGAEVNRAIAPIEARVTGRTTEDAIARANEAIDAAYERVKPHVYLDPKDANAAMERASKNIGDMPMVDSTQLDRVTDYMGRRFGKVFENGQPIDGATWKEIDRELGQVVRKYRGSSIVSEQQLGEAMAEVQKQLRSGLRGTTDTAVQDLQRANAAYRNMLDVEKAATRAVSNRGRFSPTQFRQVAGEGAGDLNTAARDTLTAPIRNATLPRMAAGAGGYGIGGGLGGAAALVGGTVGAGLIYNPASLNFIVNGLAYSPRVAPAVAAKLRSVTPQRAMEMIEAIAAESPSFAQVVSQLGRAYAAQGAEQ